MYVNKNCKSVEKHLSSSEKEGSSVTPSTHNKIRETGIRAVKNLLGNLPMHIEKGKLEDAFRMVDREIGGLLANPNSPMVDCFRSCELALFPSGLENTKPGKDIILLLNSDMTMINIGYKQIEYKIPKALKNPEKGVAQVIGLDLAKQLFVVRGDILKRLVARDHLWQTNLASNRAAQTVLDNYCLSSKATPHVSSLVLYCMNRRF